MKGLIAVVVLAVAGCASHSPESLRRDGEKFEAAISQPHLEAARCVARKIENAGEPVWIGYPTVNIRPGITPETTELTVPGMLVAEFSAGKVLGWVAPTPIARIKRPYLQAFQGC